MRILLSIHHAPDENQGAPGATLALGRAFEELGHEVGYLSFGDLPSRMPALAKELLYPELAAWHLARRAGELDVVDASTGDAWVWLRTVRRRGRRPLVVTRTHGIEHRFWDEAMKDAAATGAKPNRRTRLYHGGLRLREVTASLRLADECLFLNHDDLDYAVARLGVARDRTAIVRNGLPQSFLGRPLASAGDAPLRIAIVGSYAERKGIGYAAAALSRVLTERDQVRVRYLGTRVPPERVLQDFPGPLGDRVEVIPSYGREELPGLLEGSHVLLSSSVAEGFSLALPEGMACGLAPVASAISGAREVVRDGENGLLVPPRDADAAAAALLRLDADRTLLERLREAAWRSAQELSWRDVAQDSLAVYERGLARLGG